METSIEVKLTRDDLCEHFSKESIDGISDRTIWLIGVAVGDALENHIKGEIIDLGMNVFDLK